MVESSRTARGLSIIGGLFDLRDSVADPNDQSLGGQMGKAVCDVLASVGYNEIPLNNRTGPGWVCEPYWDDQGYDEPTNAPPFSGGQCEGVMYTVIWQGSRSDFPGQTQNGSSGVIGPVGSPVLTVTNPQPEVIAYSWTINGVAAYQATKGAPPGQSPTPITTTCVILSVTRQDGQPDNCGDPPPESSPGPSNPGRPYGSPQPRIVGGRPVNITVEAPLVDIDGEVSFPINIDVGGINIAPTFSLPINPGVGGEPARPEPPSREGEPVDTEGDSGEVASEPSEEEERDGYEVIGYRWTVTQTDAPLSRVPNTNPAIYVRVYGNVQLALEDEEGSRFYSDQVMIRTASGSIIRAHESLKVKAVVFNKESVISGFRLTPILARKRAV